MMWLSMMLQAHAGPIDRYPVCADVTLPETGVHRIAVPLALRSREDPTDGSDLVLIDGQGNEVPFARAEGRMTGGMQAARGVSATSDPRNFMIDPGSLPVEALRVGLNGIQVARVTVRDDRGLLADDALVWELRDGTQAEVALSRPTTGPLLVRVDPVSAPASMRLNVEFQVRRSSGPLPEPHQIELTLPNGVLQENGWQRYDLTLPRALPVDRLLIDSDVPVFSRNAGVVTLTPFEELQEWHTPSRTTIVSRIKVGTVSVEQLVVPVLNGEGEGRLVLLIGDDHARPVPLTRVFAEIDGVELVVMDPGAGPFRLCGGAPARTGHTADLGIAMAELVRLFGPAVPTATPADNAAYQPVEERSGLAGPGPAIERTKFAYAHTIEGAGVVNIPLPVDLQRYAVGGLGTVRLLLEDGKQLPYLRHRGAPVNVPVTTERREVGGQSRIAVRLPEPGLPVDRVTITTPATLFDRRVAVSVPRRGGHLVPIRTVNWRGHDRPDVMVLTLDHPIEDELLITIDNDSDPPLPLGDITVTAASWDLTAVLPEGHPVSLVYGARGIYEPGYDLGLVSDAVRRRSASEATIGARTTIRKPPLSSTDRLLLGLGFAVLAASLLALCVELLRRAPQPPIPTPDPA